VKQNKKAFGAATSTVNLALLDVIQFFHDFLHLHQKILGAAS